jgi:hypothetical protein
VGASQGSRRAWVRCSTPPSRLHASPTGGVGRQLTDPRLVQVAAVQQHGLRRFRWSSRRRLLARLAGLRGGQQAVEALRRYCNGAEGRLVSTVVAECEVSQATSRRHRPGVPSA